MNYKDFCSYKVIKKFHRAVDDINMDAAGTSIFIHIWIKIENKKIRHPSTQHVYSTISHS